MDFGVDGDNQENFMVSRHRRRKALADIERERFAQEAAQAHARLMPYMIALSPLCDDYKAMTALSEAIQTAIRDITGAEPAWCGVQRSWYPS